jgi:hypothetical protein
MKVGTTLLMVLGFGALASIGAAPALAQYAGPASAAIEPRLMEIGQGADGTVIYLAHGYAAASASIPSLGGMAGGDFSFKVGGLCLNRSQAVLVPTGVSGSTTAWSYHLTGVKVDLTEEAPSGSCNYTVHVTYQLSITGAVTISQMEYTVYLAGHGTATEPAGGGLSVIR